MSEAMKQQFGLIKRPWGIYYLKKNTGEQASLKTRDQEEAQRLLRATTTPRANHISTSRWPGFDERG
jgi:hypothetical protein